MSAFCYHSIFGVSKTVLSEMLFFGSEHGVHVQAQNYRLFFHVTWQRVIYIARTCKLPPKTGRDIRNKMYRRPEKIVLPLD